ncbi:homoserine kinase [Tsuneonella sp. HG249]
MAVYTHLAAEDMATLLTAYDVGELVSAKGIAEGISNSNWLVETTTGRFILTMYERRIDVSDLPFFLGLLDHLSANGCPVPRTIHDHGGAGWREVKGKAVALIEFLPGISVDRPSPAQAHAVGQALARLHLASEDFGRRRPNPLDLKHSLNALDAWGHEALQKVDPALPKIAALGEALRADWPQDLPMAICHTDLFPDNVLMRGNRVTGMIDFYFACDEAMAYDLAVTHAAWSFDLSGHRFDQAVGAALLAGYQSVRPLTAPERVALPALAQGACLRFVASRVEDWIATPPEALVTRKEPMGFARRLQFYADAGEKPFES